MAPCLMRVWLAVGVAAVQRTIKKRANCPLSYRRLTSRQLGFKTDLRRPYFFLTVAAFAWLATHLPAKACKSFKRLSKSAPSEVTM